MCTLFFFLLFILHEKIKQPTQGGGVKFPLRPLELKHAERLLWIYLSTDAQNTPALHRRNVCLHVNPKNMSQASHHMCKQSHTIIKHDVRADAHSAHMPKVLLLV